jgi:hypothetical protein
VLSIPGLKEEKIPKIFEFLSEFMNYHKTF